MEGVPDAGDKLPDPAGDVVDRLLTQLQAFMTGLGPAERTLFLGLLAPGLEQNLPVSEIQGYAVIHWHEDMAREALQTIQRRVERPLSADATTDQPAAG